MSDDKKAPVEEQNLDIEILAYGREKLKSNVQEEIKTELADQNLSTTDYSLSNLHTGSKDQYVDSNSGVLEENEFKKTVEASEKGNSNSDSMVGALRHNPDRGDDFTEPSYSINSHDQNADQNDAEFGVTGSKNLFTSESVLEQPNSFSNNPAIEFGSAETGSAENEYLIEPVKDVASGHILEFEQTSGESTLHEVELDQNSTLSVETEVVQNQILTNSDVEGSSAKGETMGQSGLSSENTEEGNNNHTEVLSETDAPQEQLSELDDVQVEENPEKKNGKGKGISEKETSDTQEQPDGIILDIGTKSGSEKEITISGKAVNGAINATNKSDALSVSDKHDDSIQGTAGADTLSAGIGNDTMDGGEGNDLFLGGAGDDYAVGGSGDDVYEFGSSDGHDTFIGGDDGGWADTIVLTDGAPSGEIGDWLELTSGSVQSSSDGEIFLSDDASGKITIDGEATLTFEGVEKIEI